MQTTPIWRKTAVAGLYENTQSGTYYSRYSLNGRRAFRALGTKVFTVAKLKHVKRMADVEADRQRGADVGSDFKTLGSLFEEMTRRLKEVPVAENTTIGRAGNLERLRKHWQRGSFATFPARNVTSDAITELREHLLHTAEWRYKFQKRPRKGFRPLVVNQTLWVLRVMLDIGVEKMVLIENPFAISTTLRASLFAKGRIMKRSELPDRPTMVRVFNEMRRVPPDSETFRPNPEQRRWLELNAEEMADHAELLAYSGMRRDEAVRSTLADDRGTEFKIWGTKSETSDRTIPVNSALRAVLDRYRTRRMGNAKLVMFAEPRTALQRACERLGLPRMKNHDLRHFFASVCIASGVDIPTVSRWMGHADGGALAMRTYGHLLKDASQAAAAKVDFREQRVG